LSAYEQVKAQVDGLQTRFYAALAACDDYRALLDRLAAEEQARDEPNEELIRRLRHQQLETKALADALEDQPLDALLRIVDRILMVKRTEEGDFR
jgi:hypothetical protein